MFCCIFSSRLWRTFLRDTLYQAKTTVFVLRRWFTHSRISPSRSSIFLLYPLYWNLNIHFSTPIPLHTRFRQTVFPVALASLLSDLRLCWRGRRSWSDASTNLSGRSWRKPRGWSRRRKTATTKSKHDWASLEETSTDCLMVNWWRMWLVGRRCYD